MLAAIALASLAISTAAAFTGSTGRKVYTEEQREERKALSFHRNGLLAGLGLI